MRALLINEDVRAAIAAARARARAHPLSREKLEQLKAGTYKAELTLADRPPDFERPDSDHVLIPIGYRAALSFEEQPAGLCRHLSVSVSKRGKMPNPVAVEAIALEFGFREPILKTSMMWIEEFEPGHHAINLVQVCEEENDARPSG